MANIKITFNHTIWTVKLIFATALLFNFYVIQADEAEEEVEFEYAEENQKCFDCHGDKTYYYYNDWIEKDVRDRMNPYYIIDSTDFYQSTHKSFRCTDCHSEDYSEFPHSGELRMEEKYACIDCHGGDEDYAKYEFERLEEEYLSSVHSGDGSENFTCWMCHDPHSYRVNARTNESILETVQYNNDICLSCHSDMDKYQLISNLSNPNIIETHKWLPNQGLHFQKVRCIECHADLKDDIMIAHNIQPKDKAVKKCAECHSQNSLLMASLYKFKAIESRDRLGFVNAVILNDSYIIGANRNIYLNTLSLIIFGFVVIGIAGHSILRIIKK